MAKKLFSVYLEPNELEDLKKIAKKENRSLGYFIREAVKFYLKRKNYERNESIWKFRIW